MQDVLWKNYIIRCVDEKRAVKVIGIIDNKDLTTQEKFASIVELHFAEPKFIRLKRTDEALAFMDLKRSTPLTWIAPIVDYSVYGVRALSQDDVFELVAFIKKSPEVSNGAKDVLLTYLADRSKLHKGPASMVDTKSFL